MVGRFVIDISLTSHVVKYQSQTYLPFAFKNVTGEWYINHKPTYHLLSRNVTGECSVEGHDKKVLCPVCASIDLRRDLQNWYSSLFFPETCISTFQFLGDMLTSKRRVVSDISITNFSFTIKMVTCEIYQSRDWWVKYQSQTYLPFAFKNVTGSLTSHVLDSKW
jgi:hypothetical protein